MNRQYYAYVDVGRSGLGNMMFPWARAEIFCHQYGAKMLSVPWVKLKRIGPWLRRETDKRYYFRLFDNYGYVGGLKKALILGLNRRIQEEEVDGLKGKLENEKSLKPVTVVFRGIKGRFKGLVPMQEYIRDRVFAILHERLRPRIEAPWGKFIGVHVRRGDFAKVAAGEKIPLDKWNYQIPDEWYIGCIENIRSVLGSGLPVVLFTNGKHDEITMFRKVKNLTVAKLNPAIVDILLLSQSAVLVGSGSSFSQWAEFFGKMPSVWYTEKHRQALVPEKENYECVAGEGGHLPESFVNVLNRLK